MSGRIAITARELYDPPRPPYPRHAQPEVLAWRSLRPRSYLRMLRDFYRDPLSWVGLLVTMLILGYAGGAVLFYLHAVVLGELGPAINPYQHWALDSTLGFVGLTPLAAAILPGAAWAASSSGRLRHGTYAVLGGVLFAFAVAPGPIAHDLLVGRGTWLANRVTEWLGSPNATGMVGMNMGETGDGVSQFASIGAQVIVGIPTYIALVWLTLATMRGLVRSHRAMTARRRTAAAAFAE
jgi:hypothetical protein